MFELTGMCLSALLLKRRKEKEQRWGRFLDPRRSILGCSCTCEHAPLCTPGPCPLSLEEQGVELMKRSVLVSTGPSWPLHHLLVSARAFEEHSAV